MSASDLFASAFSGLQTMSDVSAPVGDYVAGKLPPGGPPDRPPDPAEMLNQIALDKDLFDGFASVLFKLGYALVAEVQVNDRFGYSRTVTLAKFGDEIKFYLIVIPKSILENSRQANLAAIGLLEHMYFSHGSRLYVVSRGLSAMDYGFPELMAGWEKSKSLKAKFISWSLLNKFLGEKDENQRISRMQQMLELDTAPSAKPQVKPVPTSQMTIEEVEAVVRLMMKQAVSPALPSTQDYFNNLTLRAYLTEADKGKLAWKGNTELDARMLVNWAKDNPYPEAHERGGQKYIGWILKAVVVDLDPDDAAIVINIILQRGLISDPKVVEELQLKLNAGNTE